MRLYSIDQRNRRLPALAAAVQRLVAGTVPEHWPHIYSVLMCNVAVGAALIRLRTFPGKDLWALAFS